MSSIRHIVCLVPEFTYPQQDICDYMVRVLDPSPVLQRKIRKIYRRSGIEQRYSVLPDFTDLRRNPLFGDADGQSARTRERNDLYIRSSEPLFVALAEQAVAECPGVGPEDITHVITVSCTGFVSPGPDFPIVRTLGLRDSVQRFHLGFMGCYAAFPALKMADAFCRADPNAVVLIVCVELCTLHFQRANTLDAILSAALFSDGGAAAVVTAQPAVANRGFSLRQAHTATIPAGEKDMAWVIGDHGFDIVLSRYVAEIINADTPPHVLSFLERAGIAADNISAWALHPGGRAIIDKLESSLEVAAEKLDASRRVLRDYGNMSSPTIFFVLQDILRNHDRSAGYTRDVVALAFGPGLTIEMCALECDMPGDEPAGSLRPASAVERRPNEGTGIVWTPTSQ